MARLVFALPAALLLQACASIHDAPTTWTSEYTHWSCRLEAPTGSHIPEETCRRVLDVDPQQIAAQNLLRKPQAQMKHGERGGGD